MREDGRRVPAFAESVIRLGLQPFCRVMWKPELTDGRKRANFEKPCFVYGNHSHNYDPFILNIFTPWMNSTAGVLTQEYFRHKFMNAGLRNIELHPTKKHVPEPHLIRFIYKQIQLKRSFLIYPEGGRRWDGQPAKWIESTAKIFAKSGIPIYPIATYGSYVGWPRWAKYPRPGKMKIKIHEPLQFDRKTPFDEVLAKLKAPIDFDECIVDDDIKPKWAYRPADGIHRLLYRDLTSGANGSIYTPDGTMVLSKTSDMRYKMLPDSTLLDEKTGEIVTTAALYKKIKQLPIDTDKNGVVVQDIVILHHEDEFPVLNPHGDAKVTMYKDAVKIESGSLNTTLPMEEILYVGIERSNKLQLFLAQKMIQFTFHDEGSALQWQDTIQRIQASEKADATSMTATGK